MIEEENSNENIVSDSMNDALNNESESNKTDNETENTHSNLKVVNQLKRAVHKIQLINEYRPISEKLRRKQHEFEDSQNLLELNYKEASQLQIEDIDEIWDAVKKTCDTKPIEVLPLKNRKNWRTIRIFVSSTFVDFHQEREVLVKEVFPDLRLWCEQKKLKLVECDLRWGVPKDSTTEETIRICLSELDRCYEENVAPFFLNLAGQRTGWVPKYGDIESNLAAQYGWIHGLSVTEMEILHGAFRKQNPNALFMLRNNDCMIDIPDSSKSKFVDTGEKQIKKLRTLREMIASKFPEESIFNYNVKGLLKDNKIHFEGLSGESEFSKAVYNFFQKRIEYLYPLDPGPEDRLQEEKEAHETFLDSRSQCVLGRDQLIDEISEYINGENPSGCPLVVVGTTGAGKSALMAKCASNTITAVNNKTIPVPDGFENWNVFFHFIGATPGSTDLVSFLRRLTKELNPESKEIARDLETLMQLSNRLLSSKNTKPIIVFIDAVNQLDEDKQQYLSRWIPEKLSPNVRLVVSMIEETASHETMKLFKPPPKELICGPLDMESRKEIITDFFQMYNKKLHNEQMNMLLKKDGSSNPLWLILACEELRVFGVFETLENKIMSLPKELISLEMEMFTRFEKESNGVFLTATLCLLETSRHGLLETELLALLGDGNNIKCPDYQKKTIDSNNTNIDNDNTSLEGESFDIKFEAVTDNFSKLTKENTKKMVNLLPARDWAIIYRNLKSLLRPCGDLGEGRLDFYHQSLSKAVRKKYFEEHVFVKHVYSYWHGVLANYFENVNDINRKAEELPYHLEQLCDEKRLINCLLEWPVFNCLYDEDFSSDLLHYWQKAGGYNVAYEKYKENLSTFKQSGVSIGQYAMQLEKIAIFLIQCGEYSEALSLLESRASIEIEELGERPEHLADIYYLIAKCKSEVIASRTSWMEWVSEGLSYQEENQEIIDLCHKSQSYRMKLEGEEHKLKLEKSTLLLCERVGNVGNEYNDENMRTEVFDSICQAVDFFEQVNDVGHLSEAIMVKASVHPRKELADRLNIEKLMLKAEELCLKAYGERHMAYVKLCINIGLMYRHRLSIRLPNFKTVEYFEKAAKASTLIFGENHPITLKAKRHLKIRLNENKMNDGASDVLRSLWPFFIYFAAFYYLYYSFNFYYFIFVLYIFIMHLYGIYKLFTGQPSY